MATVRKHGNYWHAYVRINGKEVSRSTKYPYLKGNRNKKQAQKWADEWEASLAKTSKDVYSYCLDYYRTKESMGQIERSTMLAYDALLLHVRNFFGDKSVTDLNSTDIQGFMEYLLHEQSYAPNTVKKTYNVLAQALRHGVKTRELAWNPCDAVVPPSQTKMRPNPLTDESRRQFVARMSDLSLTPEVMAVWIAYYTGMRRGEICALRWEDVGDVMNVRSSIGIANGGTYEKGTKTGETRQVPIPKSLRVLLGRRHAVVEAECASMGVSLPSSLYVCGDIDGRYLNPSILTKWWGNHSREWGLMGTQGKRPTLHDLRHTYATFAVRALDIKTAQSVMGHANVQMTMSYADTDTSHVLAAASTMEMALAT